MALAPKGGKPGLVLADTAEVTARAKGVDAPAHRVTLQFVYGSCRTLKVNPAVDLNQVSVGDAVTVQVADALVLLVENP